MNFADAMVILIILGLISVWIYFKKVKSSKKSVSRCAGCSNYGFCNRENKEKQGGD